MSWSQDETRDGREVVMLFGQGFTGLIVAAIVSLSSGAAFMICFRELAREMFSKRSFDKTLRRRRNVLLDDKNGGFTIDDSIFAQLIQTRTEEMVSAERSWQSRTTYLFTLVFLGTIALGGFVAGISHFA